MSGTVAVVAQDPGRLRQLWRLLEAAEVPAVAAVMPESGGPGGMRAFLARHDVGVVLYDLAPGRVSLPDDTAAAVRFFRQVQHDEPGRRFVVLSPAPPGVLAGAGPSNRTAVLPADPAPDEILAAVRRAQGGPSRRADTAGDRESAPALQRGAT
jgi:hypothetical protein